MCSMKIALLSDTHDNTPAIVWIIEYLNENNIEIVLHAGDLINPGVVLRFNKYYKGHLHYVFGNNDGERAGLMQRTAGFNNVTCHGDTLRMELGGRTLFMHHFSEMSEEIAKSGTYDVCVGGHDHQYRVVEGPSLFINPGNTVTKDAWLSQEADKESGFVLLDLDSLAVQRIMLPIEFQA